MSGRYFLRGVYLAVGIVLAIAMAFLIRMAFSYDGKCGGFFPTSAARPCSMTEYLFGDVLAFVLIVGKEFWPFVLGVVFLPPFLGYLLDRRARSDAG